MSRTGHHEGADGQPATVRSMLPVPASPTRVPEPRLRDFLSWSDDDGGRPPAEGAAIGPRGPMDSPFFRSKFRIPKAPHHYVSRPRLLDLLTDLADYPVTAIVAPAGTGKTTLAADWLRHQHLPYAWLTLDTSDRDPVQFWRSVMAVLEPLMRTLEAGRNERSNPTRAPSSGDAGNPITADEVGAGETVTLVVDDVHHLEDDDRARAALASLVQDRPPAVRLLLLSRNRLPLPVDRLRAAGDLADIHFDALRFSPEEGALLLSSLCPDLSAEDLGTAVERAGGWAAALKLTQLSIRSRRSSAATSRYPHVFGPDKLVDEYLWQEVFRGEPPELIRMLLATAVVGRLDYGLAEALTGRPDAGSLLEDAEDRGLFVTSLDDGWFQVHSLVRDMLVSKYRRRWPMGLHEQHARAARWFESNGDAVTALDHWRQAARPAEVLRILSDSVLGLVDSGRGDVLADVLDELPGQTTHGSSDAALRFAWCALMVERARFEDALVAAESVAAAAGTPLDPRLEILRAASASLSGDWDRCELEVRTGLEHLEGTEHVDAVGPFGWSLVASAVALGERWDDDEEPVRHLRAVLTDDASQRAAFEGARVLGLALSGHPTAAMHAASRVDALAHSEQFPMLRTKLALGRAITAAEAGDHETARGVLVELAGRPTYPDPSLQFLAALQLVELSVASGHLRDAVAQFTEAEVLFNQLVRHAAPDLRVTAAAALPSWLLASLARAGVSVSLATDNLEAAAEWAERVSDPFWGPWWEARLHLAHGRRQEANDALVRGKPRCVRHQVLQLLACARAVPEGDRTSAVATVEPAVQLAAEHGLLQTVASNGTEVLELIELAAWRVPDAWLDRLRHLLIPTYTAHQSGPVEPLTEREREVLRLLPSRLTLREVASQLYVSQNTLKFHLRAIYRKLGVDSRATAVQAAREMRLLPTTGG